MRDLVRRLSKLLINVSPGALELGSQAAIDEDAVPAEHLRQVGHLRVHLPRSLHRAHRRIPAQLGSNEEGLRLHKEHEGAGEEAKRVQDQHQRDPGLSLSVHHLPQE